MRPRSRWSRAPTAGRPCGSRRTPARPRRLPRSSWPPTRAAACSTPGDDEFSFGATFQLDEESAGSEADNGDNLVQRGTFDSPGQLKLQLDHDVPSCRIKGDQGEVFVEAEGPVDPGAWYAVTCERNGSDVELTVKALGDGAGAGTWHASGPTGSISLQGLPLTVGGKTGPDGTPVASADQFNGAVDDVFLRVE